MIKKFIALTGLIIFLAASIFIFKINSEEKRARQRDRKKKIFAVVGEETPPACNWNVKTQDRVMTENASQAIVIETLNPVEKNCETFLSLSAPGFIVNPENEQKINLEPNKKGSLSWVISAQKSGNFEITVSDIINTKILGINVTNIFGLNALQAKIFSAIGSLFGPMFTIPWWWDRLRRKKNNKEAN